MNGALPQNRFQNLNRSPNRSGNHSFSIVCSAVLDGTHSSVDRDGATIACGGRVTATPEAESTRGTMKRPIRQCGLLLMALTVCTEPALAARSYLNCQTKKAIIIDAPNGKRTSAFGLMTRRKLLRLRMARRLSSAGLTIDGSVLLATMCLMSLIVKMGIWLTQARPRRTALQLL